MGRQRIELLSAEETLSFGAQFASALNPGQIIALRGDLGAGKTTFAQGLLQGFGISEPVQSPTFSLLQSYEGPFLIHHFDLYRIETAAEFQRLGFLDCFSDNAICLIEWPQKITSLIPDNATLITLVYNDIGGRTAYIEPWGAR